MAERRDVPNLLELPAQTEAAATAEIRANVEGRLVAMSFPEGRMVSKGRELFRIDPRRYEAAVLSAEAAVEKAEADLEMAREQERLVNAQSALRQAEANLLKADQDAERIKPLAARKAVPERDLDAAIAAQTSARAAVEDAKATVRTTAVGDRMGLRQAQANLISARTALDRAKLDLEETVLTAPISGLIGKSEISVGNYVGRGEPKLMATISQLDPINVVFSIPETLYLRTRVTGVDHAALDRIQLTLADNSVYPFRGRFTTIGRTVDPKTGTIMVEAQFPNPKGILLPGMAGRVSVAADTIPGGVLIPDRAIFAWEGGKAVNIVTADNTVAVRSITVEGIHEGNRIVTKGLQGGESVVADGGTKLQPGQRVAPRTSPASTGR